MRKRTIKHKIGKFVETSWFHRTIMCVILLNTFVIGLETYTEIKNIVGWQLEIIDSICLLIFVVEIILRFIGAPSPGDFFRDPWNQFDTVIVGVGLLPWVPYFTVLRVLRLFRVFRIVTALRKLRIIVSALLRSIPSVIYVILLLGILIYVYACLGSFFFGEISPTRFGNLHRSVLTLIMVLTLEEWITIMYEITTKMPFAVFYFLSFILIGTFVALNLFVGIIVNTMDEAVKEESRDKLEEIKNILHRIEKRIEYLELHTLPSSEKIHIKNDFR